MQLVNCRPLGNPSGSLEVHRAQLENGCVIPPGTESKGSLYAGCVGRKLWVSSLFKNIFLSKLLEPSGFPSSGFKNTQIYTTNRLALIR